MGLYWVDSSISNEVVDIPRGRKQFFDVRWNLLSDIEKVCLQRHINNTIDWKATPDNKENLMVKPGFIFARETGQWDAPIMNEQKDIWYCIKTEFKNNRDWQEIFYWKDDNR